jgi:uncharacterized Zn-finger protein
LVGLIYLISTFFQRCKCPECLTPFTRQIQYKEHYDEHHRDEKDQYFMEYVCPRGDECTSIYSNKGTGDCYTTKNRSNFHKHGNPEKCNLEIVSSKEAPYGREFL